MKHMRNGFSVRMALAALVGLGVLAALPTGAKASLVGDDINVKVFICDGFFGLDSCADTVTVVAGTEFTANNGTGIGDNFLSLGAASSIDIGATTIDFAFDFGFTSLITFTDLEWTGGIPGSITGVSLTILSGTFASFPQLNFTANSVDVNVDCSPVESTPGDSSTLGPTCGFMGNTSDFRVDITAVHPTVSAVPLPAALPLFLSALAGLGFVGWRRRHADG